MPVVYSWDCFVYQMTLVSDWWTWANTTLLDSLYAENLPGYLANYASLVISGPRLRQIRMKKGEYHYTTTSI